MPALQPDTSVPVMLDTSGKGTHSGCSEEPCVQSGTTRREAPGESAQRPAGVPSTAATAHTHGLLGKLHTWRQGGQDPCARDSEGWSTPLSSITEAGSRALLREPSPTHQSAAPPHAELPWIGRQRLLPAARGLGLPRCPPGSGDPSWQDADNPLAHLLSSRPKT
ncbi:hypothetical protein HJG60_011240 [Phyllostomus discolor]|uniref:Uncharacterized protein n=1 Tax=Phyllostomus discolor TaxID=89673 RepID=A0A834A7F7_9CHIR|nr:hypothetical protein HJG60_011240 [Phyllostomus discolor]